MEAANQDMFKGPWETNQNTLGDSPAEFKGDFRNGYFDLGWDKFDDATKLKKRAIELNNGRAAMCGILGLMVHEKLGGSIPLVGDMDALRVWEPATGVTIL